MINSIIIHHYPKDTPEVEVLSELLALAQRPNLDTYTKSRLLNCFICIAHSKSMDIKLPEESL